MTLRSIRSTILLFVITAALAFGAQTVVSDSTAGLTGSNTAVDALTVTWPAYTDLASVAHPIGGVSVPVVNGRFSVSLDPSDTATPAFQYTVYIYQRSSTIPITQKWTVTASTTPVSAASVLTLPTSNTVSNPNKLGLPGVEQKSTNLLLVGADLSGYCPDYPNRVAMNMGNGKLFYCDGSWHLSSTGGGGGGTIGTGPGTYAAGDDLRFAAAAAHAADTANPHTVTAPQVGAPSLTGSYSNPSWIASLARSKIIWGGTTSQVVLGDGTLGALPTGGSTGCTYKGYWDSAVSYPVSPDTCDTVLYGSAPSNMYQSVASSTNVIPGTDSAKWQQVGYILPLRYRGAYDAGTTYVPQDIVTNAGSSFISISTSTGQTPPDPFTFPVGNSYWGVIASGSSGTATPSITTSVSPGSRTLIQGTTTTFTVTFASTALTAAITPTVTGLPAGVTASFSPTTVVSTGGATTATLTASSLATVATSTLTFTGTSGSTTGSNTATLTTDYPTLMLTNTLITNLSGGTFAVPTTGLAHWKAFQGSPNERKAGVTSIIADASETANTGGPYYDNVSTSITWADGTISSSGTNGKAVHSGAGQFAKVVVTIPDTAAHEIRLYTSHPDFWGGTGTNVVVHPADGSSADLNIADGGGGSWELHELRFLFRTDTPGGTTLTFTFPANTAALITSPQLMAVVF